MVYSRVVFTVDLASEETDKPVKVSYQLGVPGVGWVTQTEINTDTDAFSGAVLADLDETFTDNVQPT